MLKREVFLLLQEVPVFAKRWVAIVATAIGGKLSSAIANQHCFWAIARRTYDLVWHLGCNVGFGFAGGHQALCSNAGGIEGATGISFVTDLMQSFSPPF